MPSPRENPALWDYVVIGKTTLPPAGVFGHVKVSVKSKIKDDKKSPSGTNGGRSTTQGLDLADVDIELEWPDAPGQYDLVRAALDEIWPPPADAQGVAHGNTDAAGVRDIQVRGVDWPEWGDGKGHLKITAREWRPDANKSGGGTGGGAGTGTLTLAQLKAKLAAAEAKLAAAQAKNIQDVSEIDALAGEVFKLRTAVSEFNNATNTPTTSDPTKQWSKGGGGVPLGEIQPGDRVPAAEVSP
jgi:hypothetical protein